MHSILRNSPPSVNLEVEAFNSVEVFQSYSGITKAKVNVDTQKYEQIMGFEGLWEFLQPMIVHGTWMAC